MSTLVWIRGAGDLASGVGYRLFRAGYAVVMSELPHPLCVRRTVSFATAVATGRHTVEGVTAVLVRDWRSASHSMATAEIPLLIDPAGAVLHAVRPAALVDAIMDKTNNGTALSDAGVVVAIGPGFTAGVDCHAVVETQRGHWLGRAIYSGAAAPDDGSPGEMAGRSAERVLRAPCAGVFSGAAAIGDRVAAGQVVGHVQPAEGAARPVCAAIGGVLRGLIADGLPVPAGLKLGDVDPSGEVARCHAISDKSLAVAGGVLEALLHFGCKP